MKHLIITALTIMLCMPAFADNKADSAATAAKDTVIPGRKIVELGIDEKIIYVNELGLPPNTMVIDALSMFPELLGRDVNDILGRYDVQLDDVSVGFNKYSVLAHTMISEVHHVEITTDPSVAQSSNGVGGVIDIITLAVDTGLSGQTSLDLHSNFNIMPSVALSYKKDKMTIYGSAVLSYYDYMHNESETNETKWANEWDYYNKYYKGLSEAAKFGLAYQFNKRDKLTFWAIQNIDTYCDSTSKEMNVVIYNTVAKTDTGSFVNGYSNINSPAFHSQVDAILKFERLYDRPSQKLYASLTYSNKRTKDESHYYMLGNYFAGTAPKYKYSKYVETPHNISTSLYYRFHLLPVECDHTLKLKAGMNYSMEFTKGTDSSLAIYSSDFDDYTQNYTLTPYTTFYYEWGKIKMELSLKYRFKARRGRGEDADWQDNFFNDFLGNFNITYIPATNHQLRASTSRTTNAPSNLQLYNKRFYKQVENKWYQGNPNLREAKLNNVDLQYFYQYHNRKHEFQLSAAIEYVNAKDLVVRETYTTPDEDINTYVNSDVTSHIVDGRISLFWQTGIFSATFAGNIYDQIQKPTGANKYDNLLYFNLMLKPVLHFERGWTVGGQCIYNSQIYHGDKRTGNAIYMECNITKAWGPWSARLTFENTYDYLSTDVIKSEGSETLRYYNLYHCQIIAGFTYVFYKECKTKKKVNEVPVI